MEKIAPGAVVAAFFGGVAVCLAFYIAARIKATQTARRKRKKGQAVQTGKRMGAMDRILIVLGVFLLCFIVGMVVIFIVKDSVPDTLITCVFGACGLEGGVMGWIKTTKERREDRRWTQQDRREAEQENTGDTYKETENEQC